MARKASASERAEAKALVLELRRRLAGLIRGELTRADMQAWATSVEAPRRLFGDALSVLESLGSADDRDDAGYLLSTHDFEAYLRWLTAGFAFVGSDDPLALVPISIQSLGERLGERPVRFWSGGLGWFWELRFGSPATGRPFVAMATLDAEGVGVRARREDDQCEALEDLLDTLDLERGQLPWIRGL